MNNGENEAWPPDLEVIASRQEAKKKIEDEPASKQPSFDFVGKLLTYIIGFGLCITLIAVFVRLVLWIFGIDLG